MSEQIREAVAHLVGIAEEWEAAAEDVGLTIAGQHAGAIRAILDALSHETERADLLQAAVKERTAERDALAERVRVLETLVKAFDEHAKSGLHFAYPLGSLQKIETLLSPSPLVEGGR